jgi:hypothetical protein
MILAIKLRKKIKANNRRGLDCAKMEPGFSSWPRPGSLLEAQISVNVGVPFAKSFQMMPFRNAVS